MKNLSKILETTKSVKIYKIRMGTIRKKNQMKICRKITEQMIDLCVSKMTKC